MKALERLGPSSPARQSIERVTAAISPEFVTVFVRNANGETVTEQLRVEALSDERMKIDPDLAVADLTVFETFLIGEIDAEIPRFDFSSRIVQFVLEKYTAVEDDEQQYISAIFYRRILSIFLRRLKNEKNAVEYDEHQRMRLESILAPLSEVTNAAVQKQRERIFMLLMLPAHNCPVSIVPNCSTELALIESYWRDLEQFYLDAFPEPSDEE